MERAELGRSAGVVVSAPWSSGGVPGTPYSIQSQPQKLCMVSPQFSAFRVYSPAFRCLGRHFVPAILPPGATAGQASGTQRSLRMPGRSRFAAPFGAGESGDESPHSKMRAAGPRSIRTILLRLVAGGAAVGEGRQRGEQIGAAASGGRINEAQPPRRTGYYFSRDFGPVNALGGVSPPIPPRNFYASFWWQKREKTASGRAVSSRSQRRPRAVIPRGKPPQ